MPKPYISPQDVAESVGRSRVDILNPDPCFMWLTQQVAYALNDPTEMRRWREQLRTIAERRSK